MSQDETSQNNETNQPQNHSSEQKNSRFLLKTVAYSVVGLSAAVVAAPFALAGYAYWRTTQLTAKATKFAFDNPIKTIAGAAAGAGMYYAANNIDWNGIEEKVTRNTGTVTQEYYQARLGTLEETLEKTNLYVGTLEEQNELLKKGGSVIYEQYDPKLLVGIGAGSAVIGGLLGGLAGYSVKRKEKSELAGKSRPNKTSSRESLRQL